jgi:hypothetical protein
MNTGARARPHCLSRHLRRFALAGALLLLAVASTAIPAVPTHAVGIVRVVVLLRRLLRALAAAGLVLPPAVGLLAPETRH